MNTLHCDWCGARQGIIWLQENLDLLCEQCASFPRETTASQKEVSPREAEE